MDSSSKDARNSEEELLYAIFGGTLPRTGHGETTEARRNELKAAIDRLLASVKQQTTPDIEEERKSFARELGLPESTTWNELFAAGEADTCKTLARKYGWGEVTTFKGLQAAFELHLETLRKKD